MKVAKGLLINLSFSRSNLSFSSEIRKLKGQSNDISTSCIFHQTASVGPIWGSMKQNRFFRSFAEIFDLVIDSKSFQGID